MRGTPLYQSLRATIRTAVLDHVRRADSGQSFLFTDALSDDAFDSRAFEDYARLAADRGARFVAIVLDCAIGENLKRLMRAGRSKAHKLTDPQVFIDLRSRHALLRGKCDQLIEFDVTNLCADEAAGEIATRMARG